MFPSISQNLKHNPSNHNQNQQSGSFTQHQNAHNYNWGALAAHSALAAAAGYNAPTLMQGHQHASTNPSVVQQSSTSSQSTSSNTPYHQFASRNLPFAGYDYNYRSGGF